MEGLNAALEGVVHWVQSQPALALIILFSVNTLTLILAALAMARIGKLGRRQSIMLRGVDGESLERLLMDYSSNAAQVRELLERGLATGDNNTAALRQTPRRMGLVRYDAFANMGGLQSFSFALLDDQANGIVLTGLHSRNEMRVYAKPVQQGLSTVPLTPEEQRAVSSATLPQALKANDLASLEN